MASAPSVPLPPVPPLAPRFNPWPYGIIAAFVVFVGGIAALVTVARSGPNELVARDYYEQELRFQGRLDQMKRTAVWADRITAGYDHPSQKVTVTIPKEHAAAGAAGTLTFYRPAAAGDDHRQPLAPDATGTQQIDAARLSPGLWKVRLEWKVGADGFYADRPLRIGPPVPPATPAAPAAPVPTAAP